VNCLGCHGIDAIAGSLPDLRYASPAVHAEFEDIVLKGIRAGRGMPSFADLLDAKQVKAIQQYVLQRAHETSR